MPAEFFSIGIAARKLGVSATTVRDWEKLGRISPVRVAGLDTRIYSESDIESAKASMSARKAEKVPAQKAG